MDNNPVNVLTAHAGKQITLVTRTGKDTNVLNVIRLMRRIIFVCLCLLLQIRSVSAQDERSTLHIRLSGPVEVTSSVAQTLTANLQPYDINLLISSGEDINGSPVNLRLSLYEFDGETSVTLHIQQPATLAPSRILFARYEFLPLLQHIPIHPDDSTYPTITNLITALGLYTIERCDIALLYFERADQGLTLILQHSQNLPEIALAAQIKRYMGLFWGNCALLAGDYEHAAAQFTISSETHNQVNYAPEPPTNLAWTLLQMGKPEEAFDDAVWRVITRGTSKAQAIALSRRAQLYALNFDYINAINDLDQAIEIALELAASDLFTDAGLAELYTLRGQMIMLTYEWDRALADYNSAIELEPDYPDAYFHRGVLYYSNYVQVEYELARTDFEYYLQLAPYGAYAQQAADYIADIDAQLEALSEN